MNIFLKMLITFGFILLLTIWSFSEGLYLYEGELPKGKNVTVNLPEECSYLKNISFYDVEGKDLKAEGSVSDKSQIRLRSLNLKVKLMDDKKLQIKSGSITRSKVNEIAYICNDVENIHEKWLLVLQPAVVTASNTSTNTNGMMGYRISGCSAARHLFGLVQSETPCVALHYEKQDMKTVGQCKQIMITGTNTAGSMVAFVCEPDGVTPEWMTEFQVVSAKKEGKAQSPSPHVLRRRELMKRLGKALSLCNQDVRGGNSYAESALKRFQRDVRYVGRSNKSSITTSGSKTSYAPKDDLLRMARVFEISDAYPKKSDLELTTANKTMKRALEAWEQDVKKMIPKVKSPSDNSRTGSYSGHSRYSSRSSSGLHSSSDNRISRQEQVEEDRRTFLDKGISTMSLGGLNDEERELARKVHLLRGESFFQKGVFDEKMCNAFSKYKYAGIRRMLRANRYYKAISIALMDGKIITDPEDALIVVRTAFFLNKYHFDGLKKDYRALMDELKVSQLSPGKALKNDQANSDTVLPLLTSLSRLSVEKFSDNFIAEVDKNTFPLDMLEKIVQLYSFERIEKFLNIPISNAGASASSAKPQLPLPDLLVVSCKDDKGVNGALIKVRKKRDGDNLKEKRNNTFSGSSVSVRRGSTQ